MEDNSWIEWVVQIMEAVRGYGPVGYILFEMIFIFACIILLPGSILTLAAGAIYGWKIAAFLVTLGSTLGALINFYTSRYFFHHHLVKFIESRPHFRMLAHAIARKGWPLILLSRFSPIIPHSVVNYASGLTHLKASTYFITSFAGFLPLSIAYAYAGDILGRVALLHTQDALLKDPVTLVLWVVSIIVTIFVTIAFSVFITRVFREANRLEKKKATGEDAR